MPENSTLAPAPLQDHTTATDAGKTRIRQGNGSRAYANFSSAITSLLTHRRCALLALSGVFSGAMISMAMAILVRSALPLFATQVYVRVTMVLLVSIGAGAFVAGGLILMNILLVEGTERAHEFSMRLVMGARRCDIRNQLLFEALLLSVIGGFSGSACGLLVGFVLTSLLQLPLIVHPVLIVLIVSASVVPGIICGFYPALKASHLDFEKVLRAR